MANPSSWKPVPDHKIKELNTKVEISKFRSWLEGRVQEDLQLPVPAQPDPLDFEFPRDLTRLSGRQLGEAMSVYTAHLARINYVVAQEEAMLVRIKAEYDRSVAYWTMQLAPDNPRDELKDSVKARVHLKKQVIKWTDRYIEQQALMAQLRGLEKSFSAYVNTLSREVSRRDMEGKTGGRVK